MACRKTSDLNVMGESALVSHMKGKKHGDYVKTFTKTGTSMAIGDFSLLHQVQIPPVA